MIRITLKDGSERSYNEPQTILQIAESIGRGLAKAALAGKVDGRLVDVDFRVDKDAAIEIVTDRSDEGLEVIRHSTAHLLAHAVKTLFPTAQITIGPVVEDGFYYDIAYERSFTPEDIEKIEAKMQALAKADYPVERKVLSREEAIELFKSQGEHYKVQIIEAIPGDETLTAYQQDSFIDLCRGPHVPRTSLLKAFKLTKLAGAYWRGDSNNEMLQRIYGTAWADKKSLEAYLHRIEEAEKRDHRKLGKKMDLFHFQAEASGMVFWHPNGWTVNQVIRQYIRNLTQRSGYGEINTPQIVDQTLWEQSGHLAKFGEEMFTLQTDEKQFAVKPMSCPCHIQVFNQGLRSYRDLPVRFAEFGCCHRNEPSGTLHGLMRVRAMTQDDGHIFCTEEQIQSEVLAFISQLHAVYKDFGFTEILHKLSTRPEKRVGSDEVWDKAEAALSDALNASGVVWELLPGEGAFYGPKIEFSLKDCLGRIWQCGTIQVDFSMPARLSAEYIDETGMKKHPVMLHRAIVGSIERFMGILIEHHNGYLPLWLAPIQVVVMNITDRQSAYVQEIAENLQNRGFRVTTDLRNEKIGYKIREHTIGRTPYQVVIGDREVLDKTLAVRQEDGDSRTMSLEEFVVQLQSEIDQKLTRRENH